LYQLERPVLANAGDLLIFAMRTWHRASNITADYGARFSHHLVYRAARHSFQGYHQWSQQGENEQLQHFITNASPRQREVLGFPRPNDPYWNDQTRAAVKLRYPGIEL
jgi:ectoine hydroxylase-related dioxygenase (phytanoyl-CoA dioxygenase family)